MNNSYTEFSLRYLILFAIVFAAGNPVSAQEKNYHPDWGIRDEILEKIHEPLFPDLRVNILDYGAERGGDVLCTEAIQQAIDEVHADNGGTVIVPQGTFLAGAITLKSNVRLHLEEGAELRFSTDPGDYLPVVLTRWEGIECYNYQPLIYARDAENIAVTGKGVLNGMADRDHWWPWKGRREYGSGTGEPGQLDSGSRPLLKKYNEEQVPVEKRVFGEGKYLRPQFINFMNCRNILLEDITIIQSPFWLIHPVMSENIILRGVTMESHGPNNDGCDPESSRNILIENCFFNTGDDCIAIKSGRNEDGRRIMRPSENIVIRNCTMHDGHGGVVIGSEVTGGCRNVFAEDCIMNSPELDRAIRIKTNTLRGGKVDNIYVRNIKIGQVDEAVLRINCYYHIESEGEGNYLPEIGNIYLNGITSGKSKYGLYLEGIKNEACVKDIFIVDCNFEGVKEGNLIKDVQQLYFYGSLMNNKRLDQSVEDRLK